MVEIISKKAISGVDGICRGANGKRIVSTIFTYNIG